ncbi:hypothetical protein COT95_00690 [Candidatus Falkowbacteria bacterium CG10_big_fil_rev_8_21_14_0_10_37_6]|uniref:Uncharacterized protein n=1 Tax=Candidatus Falkowbacteria bacterium CG10_big_fil_rev_8_21_14_0_10_37_6 TaxID=1974563 RepID=A0A2H0V9L9_9BACT|nr:MAG: hypothetical protein COT95_00690 [Candidatus Falkowbacteria bacterium CG10_big_fil_rev_8_21_14_0_10_37_6]
MSKTTFTVYQGKNNPRKPTWPITIGWDFAGNEHDLYNLLKQSSGNLAEDWYAVWQQYDSRIEMQLQTDISKQHFIAGDIYNKLAYVLRLLKKQTIKEATFYQNIKKIMRVI